MNLPGVVVDLPTLTDKDVEDLKGFAIKNRVDFIAASFVRKAKDLENIRDVLGDAGSAIQVCSHCMLPMQLYTAAARGLD